MPLLWAIRDIIGLKGTKFGCGMALCGACTVHLDDSPIRSCSFPVSGAVGKKITTIEGISTDRSTRFKKPGYNTRYLSVDIVNQGKSCLQSHCLIEIQHLLMKRSVVLWQETFAGAAPISEFMTLLKQRQQK